MPRELQPHGTPAAYQRHRRAREEACEPCREAWGAYTAAYRAANLDRARSREAAAARRRRRGDRPQFQPCGTRAGYARHKYYGEAACFECRVACAAYEAQRRAAQKAPRS